MGRTANLRRQHDAAVDLVGEIVELSKRLAEPAMPYRVGMAMAKLTGILRIHFAQEDQTLYPYMIQSVHPASAETATRFQAEMGGLAAAFEAFAGRWASADQLRADPAGFRTESREVFAALGDRITRENHILYPIADDVQDWRVARSA